MQVKSKNEFLIRMVQRVFLVLFMLFLFGIGSVDASFVRRLKPDKFVKGADAIAIVTVTDILVEGGKCHRTTVLQLEDPELIKGKIPKGTSLKFRYTIHIFVPECPSVGYLLVPHAKDLKKGEKIIATIKKNKNFPGYTVTSTYKIDELDKIKKLINLSL